MEFAVEAQKLLQISLEGRRVGLRTDRMLKIENLTAEIDGKPILKGIDLEVPPGEVHAIMGPNGSGKSTLSYVLSGREGYEVTGGTATLQRPRPAGDGAGGARGRRPVPRLPVSGRTAGRGQRQLPAHRAERHPQGRAARRSSTRCSS